MPGTGAVFCRWTWLSVEGFLGVYLGSLGWERAGSQAEECSELDTALDQRPGELGSRPKPITNSLCGQVTSFVSASLFCFYEIRVLRHVWVPSNSVFLRWSLNIRAQSWSPVIRAQPYHVLPGAAERSCCVVSPGGLSRS